MEHTSDNVSFADTTRTERTLKPHEQRVIDEQTALLDKAEKLRSFLETDVFNALPEEDQLLLTTQLSAMVTYLGILAVRVARF